MSRTWHATGTGSFTRASEVRADRRQTRLLNKGQALIERDVAMFGATHENPTGKITYEEAQKMIKNGDKIRTPDGKLHTVRANNRDELIGRLGAVIEQVSPQRNPLQPPQRTVVTYRGNLSKPDKVKIERKSELTNTNKTLRSYGTADKGKLRVSTTNRTQKIFREGVRINPRSKYIPSRNSKKTETKNAGNTRLRTKQAFGGLRPKAIRSARADNLIKKRAFNRDQREAFAKAAKAQATKAQSARTSIPKPVSAPKSPAASKPRASSTKGASKARTSRPAKSGSKKDSSTRKGGRNGRGRSR